MQLIEDFEFTHNEDVVRRGVPRELHCKLTDEEFTRIAKTRAQKEAERDELEADLAKEKKKRQDQIDEVEDEVGKMGRELRTGEQERTVKCNELFRKHEDNTGWIYVIRLDTFAEVERRPANAHEMQRYLPMETGAAKPAGLLDQASKAQRTAQDPTPEGADVPSGDEAGDDDADGEGKPKRGKKSKAH